MPEALDPAFKELLACTDRLFNGAIVEGVLRDAQLALDGNRHRAALILTYSGIDVIASLMRPADKERVTRDDFIGWVDKYMDFGMYGAPTGIELYSARCGMLHAYSIESDLTKQGKARQIGYVSRADRPVVTDPEVAHLVLLSIRGLVRTFHEGVLGAWQDIEASPDLVRLVHERLQLIFQEYRER